MHVADNRLARVLLDEDPTEVVLCTVDLHILEMNASAAEILGQNAVGNPLADHLPREVGQTLLEQADQLCPERPTCHMARSIDGTCFAFHFSLISNNDQPLVLLRRTEVVGEFQNRVEVDQSHHFQELIGTIAAEFINFDPSEFDRKADRALELLGSFVGADRAYIYILDDEARSISNTHMWCAPGVPNTLEQNQNHDAAPFNFMDTTLRYHPIAIQSLDELPPEAEAERRYMADRGVKSIMLAPLLQDGKTVGFIGFSMITEEKKWPKSYGPLLNLFGEVVVSAINSRQGQIALESARSRYQSIVEQLSELLCRFRPDGMTTYANPACRRFFGRGEDEMWMVEENLVEHERERFIASLHNAPNQGEDQYFEAESIAAGGERRIVRWRRRAVFDHDGQLVEFQSAGNDVTQQRMAERAVAESERKYGSLIEAIPASVAIVRDMAFVFGNRSCVEMFGYDNMAEIAGLPILAHVKEEYHGLIAELDRQWRKWKVSHTQNHSLILRRKDGSTFPAEIYLSVTSFDGLPAVQTIVIDMTQQKEHEQQLANALEYQRVLNRMLSVALGQEMDVRVMIEHTLDLLKSISWLGAHQRAAVYLVENDLLIMKANLNLSADFVLSHSSLDFSHGGCGEAAATGRIARRSADTSSHGEAVHIPMLVRGQVMGVFSFYSDGECVLSEDQEHFLETLSNTLAVTLHRRLAEEQVRASEARVTAIVKNVLDGLITIDTQGILESCNPAAAAIFNSTEDALVGTSLARLIPGVSEYESPNVFLRQMEGQVAREFSAVRESQERFPLELSISEVRLGQRVLFVGILRDITDRKRVVSELIKAKEDAEAANHAKTLFLATMSHELRTPLNSVIGFTRILLKNKDGRLSEQQLEFLQRVLANGQQLLDLISDILDISRIESGKLELVSAQIALKPLLEEIIEHHLPMAHAGISLRSEVPDGLVIQSDPSRLRQILNNLVSNATKFTEKGTVTLTVAVVDGEPKRIDVIDTGIGISKELHERIFEAFVQANTGTARRYQGSGLGLKISHRLCRTLGYELTVDSEPGAGSTFSIHLKPDWKCGKGI